MRQIKKYVDDLVDLFFINSPALKKEKALLLIENLRQKQSSERSTEEVKALASVMTGYIYQTLLLKSFVGDDTPERRQQANAYTSTHFDLNDGVDPKAIKMKFDVLLGQSFRQKMVKKFITTPASTIGASLSELFFDSTLVVEEQDLTFRSNIEHLSADEIRQDIPPPPPPPAALQIDTGNQQYTDFSDLLASVQLKTTETNSNNKRKFDHEELLAALAKRRKHLEGQSEKQEIPTVAVSEPAKKTQRTSRRFLSPGKRLALTPISAKRPPQKTRRKKLQKEPSARSFADSLSKTLKGHQPESLIKENLTQARRPRSDSPMPSFGK